MRKVPPRRSQDADPFVSRVSVGESVTVGRPLGDALPHRYNHSTCTGLLDQYVAVNMPLSVPLELLRL